MAKLILYAPNVHTGGGKTLLIPMLKVLESFEDSEVQLILDKRLDYKTSNSNKVLKYIKSSFYGRFIAERILKKNSSSGDVILCFHSLPPIFKNEAKVFLYFHNRHLINKNFNLLFNEKARVILRILLEKSLARIFYKNVDIFLVQSNTMKQSLDNYYSPNMSQVQVLPFMEDFIVKNKSKLLNNVDFVYISDGLKHKNHDRLLQAWILLSEEGIFPKLTFTLSNEYNELLTKIDYLVNKHQIKIENLGYIDFNDISNIYSNAQVLIFPSLMESFGMPLIEAKLAKLPILASELDYVRDVCDPIETFDPRSEVSIARAVKRYLGTPLPENKIYSPLEFVDYVFKSIKK